MNVSNLFKPNYSIAALRMMVAVVFILHASARIYNNTLFGFGDFLDKKGFPFGFFLAWAITLFELVGGVLMFFRYYVRLFCLGEIIILIVGIITFHWEKGLMGVDMSLSGAEYSMILITILFAIYIAERKASRKISRE